MSKIKFLILFSILMILSFFIGVGSFSNYEHVLYDAMLSNSKEVTSDVIIIGIDNESLENIGRFPWDRDVYATLINNLEKGGAAAVGFDIIWSEVQGDQDYILRDAIEQSDSVLLATYGELNGYLKEEDNTLSADYFYYPNDILMEAYPYLGFINTALDDDNVVRRALPYIYDEETDTYMESFNYQLYHIYCEKNNIDPEALPTSYFDRPYINYYGSIGSIETIPFYMALDENIIPPEYFENKIVLIGMTASGGEDIYLTPAGAMYGVEIHGNFINNLLLGNYKTTMETDNYLSLGGYFTLDVSLFLFNLLVGMLYIFIALKIHSNYKKYIVFAVCTVAYFLFVRWLFYYGIILKMIYPIIIAIVLLFADTILDFFENQREKRKITTIFSRYMSEDLVKKVISEGTESIKLGGVKKDITAMFIDVRGFTTMSEKLEPEEVMDVLNEYLSMATESIFHHEGLLDKYIGDGLMALFNAPYDIEEPELRCVKTAFEIKNNGKKLYDTLFAKYGVEVKLGIGINCGDAIIGNVGSERRMDYTAIGDTINTAARLESNAKGGQILISEKVYDRIKDSIEVELVGELSLKGKENNILTYSVIGIL